MTMRMVAYHEPVLLSASVEALNIRPDGTYADLTFGGGGHSAAILERLGPNGRLIAFDQDPDAWANAPIDPRFTLVKSNFRYARNFLRLHHAWPVDGLLADLGVSSHQFDEADRGFSIRMDGPLDMRMAPTGPTAADLVNTADENDLARMLRQHSDLKEARRVARILVMARQQKPLATIYDLIEALSPVTPPMGRSTFLARVFQALRMEVNDEVGALAEMLGQMPDSIAKGGRLVVIAYHSVEDRMVKDLVRSGNVEGRADADPLTGRRKQIFRDVAGGVVTPSDEELTANPRARSAKMRVAERV